MHAMLHNLETLLQLLIAQSISRELVASCTSCKL